MSYFARVSVRDGRSTIGACLNSILFQTLKPMKVIVVDDGSSDGTSEIIEQFRKEQPEMIEVIQTGSTTRDYSRLPVLLNLSLEKARHCGCKNADYHFSTGGDCSFSPGYVEKVIGTMERDQSIAVASGDFGQGGAKAPHGSGRVIRQSFFNQHYPGGYERKLGYESEILERAISEGYDLAVIQDARFKHLEKMGHAHNFKEFGWGMKTLGYYPPYALTRVAWDFKNNATVGRKGALQILFAYLSFRPAKHGYYSPFSESTRAAIRQRQKRMFVDIVKESCGYNSVQRTKYRSYHRVKRMLTQ